MVYPKIESKMSVLKRHLYFQNARADFAMAVVADYPGGAMETFIKITKKLYWLGVIGVIGILFDLSALKWKMKNRGNMKSRN